jgi:hypothetical protein
MSRQQFTARNNIGSVLTFQKSGATASFDPNVSFSSGTRRVSWKLNNGTNVTQTTGNSITYTGFTSDTGIRTIEMRGNSFRGLNQISLNSDNLYGNLDLTQLSDLGGTFWVQNNPNLTGITHVPSSQIFTQYLANNCNLTGNLNVPFSGLGGVFWVQSINLTGITHVPSSQIFTAYYATACNLTGNLNLPLSGLGGEFQVYFNSGLTSINHASSTQNFSIYDASDCNLTGTLDISPLTKLGGANSGISGANVLLISNTILTGIKLPSSTQFFKNQSNIEYQSAFGFFNCNLDYVDFTPLSGATLLSGTTQGIPRINLRDNNMSAADVNHILVDFSGNATYNPTGWSNVNLNISGTNGAPDSGSGGYNGIGARNFLTGSPYNWTITHT